MTINNGYYIIKDRPTEKISLEPKEVLYLDNMNLIELVLPKCKKVYCYGNRLTELIIPDGVEIINCSVNNITELILPKSCIYLDCYYNELIKLIVQKTCEKIYCRYNKLYPIVENLLSSKDPIKIELANNIQLANNLQK
jgi:hypothetical protein